MSNLDLYNKYAQPPQDALKSFNNGRFKGTDINPMWRIKALTEHFGPCGLGWYTKTTRMWREDCKDGTAAVFCEVELYVKYGNEWSAPIVGVGGNTLERVSKNGNQVSDEAYKMAYTDALGIACKALGIGADIWWKSSDGSKYAQYVQADTTPPEGYVKASKTTPAGFVKTSVVPASETKAFDPVTAVKELARKLKLTNSEFAACRASLIEMHLVPDLASKDMTEGDVQMLAEAFDRVYGEAS